MKKKLLSCFLTLSMMFVMLPVMSLPVSAGIIPVYVNGINIAAEVDDTVDCGGGTAVYDFASGTLTLTNATIETPYEYDNTQYGIYSERDLTIILTGDESLHIIDVDGNSDGGNIGLFVDGDLTISSTAEDAVLQVLSYSCAENFNGCGIYTTGKLTVSNCGVQANSITFNGTEAESYGIYSEEDIEISNSNIWAFARKATDISAGIYCEGNISITNDDPDNGTYVEGNATSASTPAVSYGIYAQGTLTVDGAKNPPSPDWVVGNCNSDADTYCAIYAGAASGAITLIDMAIKSTTESAFPSIGGVISNDGHFIARPDGTTMPAYADLWGSLGSNLQSPAASTAPSFADTTATKAAVYQQSVDYTLNSALPTGTLKVYGAASGGTALTDVIASVTGTTLTLAGTGTDLAEGNYWITLTETGKGESARVQLTAAPAADVVIVSGEADLAAIAADVNDGTDDYSGKTIKQTADITLTADPWTSIGIAFNNNPFCGTYDGGGYIISGLKIDAKQDNNGLFGAALNADIKNLTIADPTTNGANTDTNETGILVGHYRTDNGDHSIDNVHVTGSGALTGVYGVISYVDAFTGTTSMTINNVSSTVSLSGDRGWIGGIIGYSGNSDSAALSITNCCTTGDVSSSWTYIGGLIGQVASYGTFTIDSCYTAGDISGTQGGWVYTGGIVGEFSTYGSSTGKITNCYSMGDIEGDIGIGGIAGVVYINGTSTSQITNVFATGTVTAGQYAGGIFGSAATANDDTLVIDHAVALNRAIVNTNSGTNDDTFCRVGYDDTNNGAIANSYAFKGMTVIDANTYIDDVTPEDTAVLDGINGLGISKSQANKAVNWLTYLDVASGHAGYGKWTNGAHKLPNLTALSSDDNIAMPDHLDYKALNSESAASRSYTAGNTTGICIDSQIEVYGPDFSGAKVIINDYDAASDTVTWSLNGTGITVQQSDGQDIVVDGTSGAITFTGEDTAAHYQQVLRSVRFVTTAATGSRSISFSLGESAAYGGHYYEFIAFTAGTQKTWEESKVAASRMEFDGQSGYLVTIQSQEENDFIASKLGANGWIGGKGTMNSGVKEWKWVTDPDPAVANEVFFTQDKDHTSPGWNSGMVMGTTADNAYSNFNGGEPNGRMIVPADNNAVDTEWCGEIYSGGASAGKWNDLQNTGYASNADLTNSNSQAAKGYVVEYNAVSAETVVTKTVNITAQSSGGSSGGSGRADSPIARVNGQPTVSGTVETTISGGRTTTTVTINQSSLSERLSQAGSGAVVTIPFTQSSDTVTGKLNGQMVKDMENNTATLVIQTQAATYTLPADQINISAVSDQIGTKVTLSDISVDVSISASPDETVRVVKQAADDNGLALVVPAVDFEISCTYNGVTVDVSQFKAYVERMIAIPDGVDPSKITTGVVVKPDGTTRHVPTRITVVDGVHYAVINSLANSTYSVVWHPFEFNDVSIHWAKSSVNNMGSRMVVTGVGGSDYEPDRNITRAEFAAIVVRALGLDTGMGDSNFNDVASTAWYYGYIRTAAGYGIISGYSDETFGPSDTITREQTMTMIARAMKLTKLASVPSDSEIASLLSKYTDVSDVSDYAKASVASCIDTGVALGRSDHTVAAKDFITRAEVAVIVERLLQKSNLI